MRGRVDDFLLQRRGIDLGNALTRRHPDDVVQPRQGEVAHPRGVLDTDPVEGLAEDLLDPQAHRGVVAVPRDVDQAGHEPAVVVLPQEEAGLAPLLQVDDRGGDILELVDQVWKRLLPRVVLHDLQDILAQCESAEAGPLEDTRGPGRR